MEKIKHDLSDSNLGWDLKEVVDLIQQKTGFNIIKNTSADYFKVGFFTKDTSKRFVRTAATPEEKNKFKKRVQQVLSTLKYDWNVLVED
jgi:hypothetical protein